MSSPANLTTYMRNYQRLSNMINQIAQQNPSITGFDDSWLKASLWEPAVERILERLDNDQSIEAMYVTYYRRI